MAFCSKCGAQLNQGAAFCPACGAATGATTATGSGAAPAPAAAATGMTSNVAAMLCYLPFAGWIISIIFLCIEPQKNDRFVRFAAFQAIFITVAMFVLWWVFWYALPLVLLPLSWLVRLGILVLQVFLMFKAYNNEKFKVPVIGDMAEKQVGA